MRVFEKLQSKGNEPVVITHNLETDLDVVRQVINSLEMHREALRELSEGKAAYPLPIVLSIRIEVEPEGL